MISPNDACRGNEDGKNSNDSSNIEFIYSVMYTEELRIVVCIWIHSLLDENTNIKNKLNVFHNNDAEKKCL